jgi:hypothetical protein
MTSTIQTTLQDFVLDAFRPIHERLQARKVKRKEVEWEVVFDAVRRYVQGNYQHDKIQSYIYTGIRDLTENMIADLQGP